MDKACRLLNSTVMGLTPRCPIEADYNIYLIEIITVGAASAGALIIASLLAILFLPIIGRVPLTGILSIFNHIL